MGYPKRIFQYFATLCLLCVLCFGMASAWAQSCSIPGQAGTVANLTAQPNTFFPGTGNPAIGATSIVVTGGRGINRNIVAGDLLLIIQMQGADINSSDTNAYGDNTPDAGTATVAFGATGYAGGVNGTNFVAGNYEWAVATGGGATFGAGGTINLSKGLSNAYFTRTGNVTQGKQAYQVIRVPQYANVTLTGGFSVLEWNGSSGGVLAMDAAGDINLNGQTINGNGRGFRGAGGVEVGPQCTAPGVFNGAGCQEYVATIAAARGGSKGEGTVGTPARIYSGDTTGAGGGAVTAGTVDGYVNGEAARGAPGNAGGGGNQHNAGGGGGGNGGAGGNGGNSWNSSNAAFIGLRLGGFGGSPSGNAAARWLMGGGGGAGDVGGNGLNQPDGSGGAGGALVILRASRVVSAGATININGVNGQSARLTDAAGGGGAGGTAVIAVGGGGISGALTVNANGAVGGSYAGGGNETDGVGGGGGGGVLISNAVASITFNRAGGAAGSTNSNACLPQAGGGDCNQRAGAATAAATGYAITSPGLQVGYECLPNLAVSKATTTPLISSATGATAAYTINITNTGGGARFVSVRDFNLPPGWTILGTPAATFTLSPITPLAAGRLSSVFESAALAHTSPWTAGAAPLINPAAGNNALNWSHFAIAPIHDGVPGAVTVSFVVSIPNTATASTYHNGAGVTYLDPTRPAAGLQTVSPLTNSTAKRDGLTYGTTNYSNFNGSAAIAVQGSNYNGLEAGPTAEDVTLLADIRLTKAAPAASAVAGRTTDFVIAAINAGRPLGSVTFATDQATTGSGTRTVGNPLSFSDSLQAGLSLAATPASSNPNWSCTGVAGSTAFTCSAAPSAFPIASAGTIVTVTATVSTTPSACPGPLIRNTATLTLATIGETDTANNIAATSLPISCTTSLSITKDNGTNTLTAGQNTTYTVTISVAAGATVSSADGAVARDTPSAGLSNCTVTGCTPSGSPIAACPSIANWPNLLSGAGLPIPGLPAGSSVAFTVRCEVTATGLP
jgi:mucin-19